MSACQFGLTLEETIKFANTDLGKVAILKTTVPEGVFKSFEFSKKIDPFIFKRGVITFDPSS